MVYFLILKLFSSNDRYNLNELLKSIFPVKFTIIDGVIIKFLFLNQSLLENSFKIRSRMVGNKHYFLILPWVMIFLRVIQFGHVK